MTRRDAVPRYRRGPLPPAQLALISTLNRWSLRSKRKRYGVDYPDPYRNLRRTRDKRLPAGRVLSVQFLRTPLDGASHRYRARFGGRGCISAMELPLPGLRAGVGRRQARAPAKTWPRPMQCQRPSVFLPNSRIAARSAVPTARIHWCSTGATTRSMWRPGPGSFPEAAALGVLQVHLSGGEPAARRDLARNRQRQHVMRPSTAT